MDRALTCAASSPGFDSCNIQMCLSPQVPKVAEKEMEPVMIKLHNLVSPSRKNQFLALP